MTDEMPRWARALILAVALFVPIGLGVIGVAAIIQGQQSYEKANNAKPKAGRPTR